MRASLAGRAAAACCAAAIAFAGLGVAGPAIDPVIVPATASAAEVGAPSHVTFSYGEPTGAWYRDLRVGSGTAADNDGASFRPSATDSMVPSVTVTASGLAAGVTYCANLNQFADPSVWFSDGYDTACATARAASAGGPASAVFRIHLVAGETDWATLDDYVRDGAIRLYAHVARKDAIVNGDAAPVAADTTGVAVKVRSVADLVAVSGQGMTLDDGSADVRATYRVDPSLADDVAGACLAVDAFRMTSLTVTDPSNANYLYLETADPFTDEAAYCGGDAGTADATEATSGAGTVESVEPRTNARLHVGDYRYQRLWLTLHPDLVADGKAHTMTSTVRLTDTGADAVGDAGAGAVGSAGAVHEDTVEEAVRALIREGLTEEDDPMASLRMSLQLRFRDGSYVTGPFTAFTAATSDGHRSNGHGSDGDGTACGAAPFADVGGSTPHVGDIRWLQCRGIATGWPRADGADEFRGRLAVARQDMAAFLYRIAGSPAFDADQSAAPFVDVDRSTPHYREILWLAQTGIATGWRRADGRWEFRGGESVERQDMAAFLHRLATWEGTGARAGMRTGAGVSAKDSGTLSRDAAPDFADVTAATPHADDIAWLAAAGVATGWTDARTGAAFFRGSRDVIRQDMAAFLHRMSVGVLARG